MRCFGRSRAAWTNSPWPRGSRWTRRSRCCCSSSGRALPLRCPDSAGGGRGVKAGDRAVALLARGTMAGLRALSWERARTAGARLGDGVRGLGLRRRVARPRTWRSPSRSGASTSGNGLLREHYRELGRVAAEYAHLDRLARAPLGEVFVETSGIRVLDGLRGRGAILLSGPFLELRVDGCHARASEPGGLPGEAAFERRGRTIHRRASRRGRRGLHQHPLTGLGASTPRWPRGAGSPSSPTRMRAGAGCSSRSSAGPRARPRAGPPVSEAGAPIVMGFAVRRPDGRFDLPVEGPLEAGGAGGPRCGASTHRAPRCRARGAGSARARSSGSGSTDDGRPVHLREGSMPGRWMRR